MEEKKRYGGDQWSVKDKVVLITGASSGIGEEMAKQCARSGAHVVLTARRSDRLQAVERACLELGAKSVLSVVGDVSVEADCKTVANAAAEKHGGVIDVVFANAGLSMVCQSVCLSARASTSRPHRACDSLHAGRYVGITARSVNLHHSHEHQLLWSALDHRLCAACAQAVTKESQNYHHLFDCRARDHSRPHRIPRLKVRTRFAFARPFPFL